MLLFQENKSRIFDEIRFLVDYHKQNSCGKETAGQYYDLLSVVMIYLDRNCDEIEDGLLGFLDVLFSSDRSLDEKRDILEKRYGVPMTEEMELEVQDMGSVGIGLLEEGYERGIERGLVQGEEREGSRFARLTELLENQKRTKDIIRAAKEQTFKLSLYQES